MPSVLSLLAAGALSLSGSGQPSQVAVIVVPPFPPEKYADSGAVGLMPPGDGTTVSREGALAALVRGRTEKSLLGGVPGGEPEIELATRPADVTIYVSLPPPGTHPNDVRYPLAVVGGGYTGILESPSTRIPGLVSIADVAPTAQALERGDEPRIGWTPGTPADLHELDRTLRRQARARDPAVAVLALSSLAFAVLALALRSRSTARAALLAASLALAGAITLSAAGVTHPGTVLVALALFVLFVGAAGGRLLDRAMLAAVFVGLIAAYLVVLVAEPTWPALAAIGPTPGEGGRFYGSTNLTTSIVVAASLFAGATLGLRWLVPVALLSIVTVGWSRAGADGGGMVVLAAGCAALGLRLAAGRLTARGIALAAGVAVAVGLALVGLDAATGGSSHVTRRVGEGPGALLGELGNRLHISYERIASSSHAALVFAVSIAALAVLATRPPRFPAGDALLVAIGVSLLVNDTPHHVAAAGALSYGVLWVVEKLDSPDMRRLPAIAATVAVAAALAGCGYEGQTTASPETVEGPVPTETTETTPTDTTPGLTGDPAAGKAVFTTNCGSCHVLSDAGTSGTVGPNLDESQPDKALVVDRVTNGQGIMPPFAGTLTEQQIADVAAYVSTVAGS
ncbi:MAG TPA: cytochrome c [Gaiellaceae bacterium]|nr:cytochrome c [Gaiellaceae bacterium]